MEIESFIIPIILLVVLAGSLFITVGAIVERDTLIKDLNIIITNQDANLEDYFQKTLLDEIALENIKNNYNVLLTTYNATTVLNSSLGADKNQLLADKAALTAENVLVNVDFNLIAKKSPTLTC